MACLIPPALHSWMLVLLIGSYPARWGPPSQGFSIEALRAKCAGRKSLRSMPFSRSFPLTSNPSPQKFAENRAREAPTAEGRKPLLCTVQRGMIHVMITQDQTSELVVPPLDVLAFFVRPQRGVMRWKQATLAAKLKSRFLPSNGSNAANRR